MTPLINFDANATTAVLPEVLEEMARCWREIPGNPGSRHLLGRRARQILEHSRETVAEILDAEPDEVHFTSGGTEANNLAILGSCRGAGRTLLMSPGGHPSSHETCRALSDRGWSVAELPVDTQGRLTEEGLADVDWSGVGFATVLLAHNETGVIQPVETLASHCRDWHIPWHLDAVQAVGKIPVSFRRLGAASLSLGGHKFHGPRGIGALLIRRGLKLTPLLHGGHQEQHVRPGTEPVPLIAGMATALQLWQRDQAERTVHMTQLRDRLQALLTTLAAPVVVHGGEAARLPNTLNIAFPGIDGEALLVALDLAGVCCSLGSTCASGSMEPAPILLAMGVSPEIAKASVRFSVSALNALDEIAAGAARIASVVSRLRSAT